MLLGDFRWFEEYLYQKKNGEFFLHGEGRALSKYMEIVPDGKGPGEKIIPIDEEEAKDWVEAHLSAEEYERLFVPVEE